MKIIITEEQYERLSGEMEEALGVPEGILDAGEQVYDLIVQELENFNGDIDDLNNDGFEIEHKFKVGDHYFYRVKVKFDIEVHPKAENADLVAMSSQNEAELDERLVFRSKRDPDEIIVGFKFYIHPQNGISDIVNYLKKYRKEDIPNFTHEIKHAFRDVKEKGSSVAQRVSYVSNMEQRELFGFMPKLNEFLFNSYFIHAIENVVRPTELAAELRINNVSKKDFLKFFMNTEMIKRLKEIQSFSYDKLKQDISKPEKVEKIKQMFDAIDKEYDGMDDEEIVNEFLRIYLVKLVNSKNELMNRFLTTNFMEQLLGLRGEKDKFFRNYVKYTTKFGDDYDAYFRNEEMNFHKTATALIKKLAKLYAMVEK